jgi:DHA1 family tetracycline resistance protein-like MFS transporter
VSNHRAFLIFAIANPLFPNPGRLRRVRALFPILLTSFIDMLGYTLLIPLLPGMAHHYGARDWMVGMLLSIPALCSMLAAPVWGKFSDRAGRKFIILIAQGFTLAGYTILGLAHSLFWIYVSRLISGVGAGSIGAAESYIADVTNKQQRDRAYALYGAVFGSAFIIGPIAAGFLQRYGLQFPFFVAALIEVVNIGLTLWLLPWRTREKHEETSTKASVRAALMPGVRRVLVRQFLFIFAVVYLLSDFALYLDHALHEHVQRVSWLLAGAGVVGGATLIGVVTPLTKRYGDRVVSQGGFALLFAAYALIYFVSSIAWFFPVLILWAAGAAMAEPTLMSLLAKRAPEHERGAIMGVSDSVNSVALILAPAIGTAIVGERPRLIGVLPALAVAAAWYLGRRPAVSQGKASKNVA